MLLVFNFNKEVDNIMLKDIKPKAKKAWKNLKEYGRMFLKFAFEELIIFAKDFWSACKFIYNENKEQWWPAAKRNWWKFAKYFGVLFVFFGLNLSLGTIGFVLGSLIVSKVLSVILPQLVQRAEKTDNSDEKTRSLKIHFFLRVMQILLPVIAVWVCVAHWWLLLPGFFMMLTGGFIDHHNKAKDNKNNKKSEALLENQKSKTEEESVKLIQNEKEKSNDLSQNIEQVAKEALNNTNINLNNVQKEMAKSFISDQIDKFKNGIKDFFYPNLDSKKNENTK